jgi:sporulation protein YlmC with PRC-barrel domain
MKSARLFVTAVSVCGLLLLTGALARADEKADEAKRAYLHKVTALNGMAVKNAKGEDLGRVRDWMIALKEGRIIYAAIGYGGTLGIGEKYFAVPLGALRIETPAGRPNEKIFVLNVDKAEFDNNPGFNKDNWPTAPDQRFMKDVRRPEGQQEAAREATPDLQKTGEQAQLRRATALTGLAVKNNNGESLGTVRDLMINTKDEKVVYAAVGYGGTLGFGEKLFAVPWEALAVKSLTGRPTDVSFVLNVDKAVFDTNPGFNKDNWPIEGDRTLFGKKP